MTKAAAAAPVAPSKDEDLRVALVEISKIALDPTDTDRILHDEAEFAGLVESIRQRGVMQPVGLSAGGKGKPYRIVWGKRRVLAAKEAGLKEIPARVGTYESESDLLAAREVENLQRRDLNPVEEAAAVAKLWDLENERLLAREPGYVENNPQAINAIVVSIAAKLGKSATWVRDRHFLAQLSGKSRELVLNGRLPITHAREIAKLADPNLRDQLAKEAASGPRSYGADREHPMKLKELRRTVAGNLYSLAQIPWKLDEPFADAPACEDCPHNSANAPGLFEHHGEYVKDHKTRVSRWSGTTSGKEPAAGVCTNPSCYKRKAVSAGSAIRAAARRAVKAMTEAGVKTVTPKAVEPHVPAHVERSRVVAAAKDQAKAKPAKSGDGAKVRSKAASQPAAKDGPNSRALKAWEKANASIEEACRDAVHAAIAKNPERAVCVLAAQVRELQQLENCYIYHTDEAQARGRVERLRGAEKTAQASEVGAMVDMLASGTTAAALEIFRAAAAPTGKKRHRYYRGTELYLEGPMVNEPVAGRILKALGSDVEYRSIEGFLAAELEKAKAAAAKPAGKKKAGKKRAPKGGA